ncbi:MAG: hypothetical protein M1828_000464, partial [Chrysothrix sp. TS-e1954]
LVEEDVLAVVEARTESLQSLRELGPPDLVHLIRQSSKSSKQVGVFHHVTGVDASSSAILAAYVNTLIHSAQDRSHKVISGLYCSYNAFSRLDMRVQVTIPGSVESYCIDERGDKKVASDALWLETYLCSVLRAYSYADEGNGDAVKKIIGCRRFNPITSTESEHRFMDAAERLFFQGWSLGSDPEIQVPNLVSNHLTTGLLKYISTTGRYTSGINLFEKLRVRDPEISSLLAQVFFAADEEVKAVRLLHDAIQELPMDYSLLDAQANFCKSKGRNDLALEIAKRSVVSAPSEFGTWSRLVEIYIALENWDLALLTLNSCPMFTYQDKDAPRIPNPDRIQLPIMPETQCDDIDDGSAHGDVDMIHPTLKKLVAGNFRGTFHKAYMLLAQITRNIGWDKLLQIRSQVFVMEEEYRQDRQGVTRPESSTQVNGNSSPKAEEDTASPSASTTALNGTDSPPLSKPSQTITTETAHAGSDNPSTSDPDPQHETYVSFRHKRLCERWLDNLFMVLYEDLRVYTIWRSEMSQAKQQRQQYNKSAEEWEILADLATRLQYHREAVEAWQRCLSVKFSPRALTGLMHAWEKDGTARDIVGAVIRLICWQFRWYSEFSPGLYKTVRRLIEEEGAVKVGSLIQSTSLPPQRSGAMEATYEAQKDQNGFLEQ